MNGVTEMNDKDIAFLSMFFSANNTLVIFSVALIGHIDMLTDAVLALGGQ